MGRKKFTNPFRPGAGHMPPYLAGRKMETDEFRRLLEQEVTLENLVLTGLRGVGKTVLLETFKPLAIQKRWLWVGTDLSESSSIEEQRVALRLITDLAVVTSSVVIDSREAGGLGFGAKPRSVRRLLNYETMAELYQATPGLVSDKLKAVLEFAWLYLRREQARGLIFAYDEAQNLSDHAAKDEYPLSLMLDVFQSLQRKNIPFMLVLTGLPTLFPKLVEARTFAERMFRVVFLDRLNEKDSREAILKPIQDARCAVHLGEEAVRQTIDVSGGYPYFIQFVCKEVYDAFLQKLNGNEAALPMAEITRKLDTDFFAGRWSRATDRQRELLTVIAHLEHHENEFTVQEAVDKADEMLQDRSFSASQISQMLAKFGKTGLVYKNRHGKYSFAVPLLGRFILRQTASP